MDKHTVISFLVAFWPLWVGLVVVFVVSRLEPDTTTYWSGNEPISRAEYEHLQRDHKPHPFIVCPRCGRKASEDEEGVYCAPCELDIQELFQ